MPILPPLLIILPLFDFSLALCFGFFLLTKTFQRDILAQGNCKLLPKRYRAYWFPFKLHDLGWKDSLCEISLTKLSVHVRTPSVNGTFLINSCSWWVFKFTDWDICEINAIHADFLGCAEHPERSGSPNDQLSHVSYCCWEPTSCDFDDIVDFKWGEFERRIEIRFFRLTLLSEAHFLSAIRAHTVNVASVR